MRADLITGGFARAPIWRGVRRHGFLAGVAISMALLGGLPACRTTPVPAFAVMDPGPLPEQENLDYFRIRSELLSEFWGRDMHIEAGVVVPPDFKRHEALPMCIYIHSFGGSHHISRHWRKVLTEKYEQEDAAYPRMIFVYPYAHFWLGHHVFADSVNTGPWGEAFVTEFLPALERTYGAAGHSDARFVYGHSSGGWSALWLQVTYPETFGGAWPISPDPVDFRSFTGVNIYDGENAYTEPDGTPIMLVRDDCGEWGQSLEEFVRSEDRRFSYGYQFDSFDAVFSPRGNDGRPMPMFDRETGAIEPIAVEHWKQYDISRVLQRNWTDLAKHLAGKLHVFMGECDTFRLEEPLRLLEAELKAVGSDAEFTYVPGGDHWIYGPKPGYWPDGLHEKIHREMAETYREHQE